MSTTSAVQYYFCHAPCVIEKDDKVKIDTETALKLMRLADTATRQKEPYPKIEINFHKERFTRYDDVSWEL
ncbi:hypothetical protein E4U14_007888 [Claviceps sp. LM454 group G7]|nr:hypothetical protein E4U14_007888 [Claviceps sp. LM454 group G7]